MKIILAIMIALLGLYLTVLLILYFTQKFVFYPGSRDTHTECDLPDGVSFFEENVSGIELNGIFHDAGHDKLFVFFHGNGESACSWRYLGKNHVSKLGYNTLVMEYPGYSGTDGKPSIKSNLAMVSALVDWFEAQDYENVAVMGFSLGTAMASDFAPKVKAEHLILIAPFDRMRRVAHDHVPFVPSFLITENYKNDVALEGYSYPVTIFHGAEDRIIYPKRSAALADELENVERFVIEGRGHNDLFDDEMVDWMLQQGLQTPTP